jgi:hypothetical protein
MSQSPARKTVAGQPSWKLLSSDVEAFLTEQGGHLAPVTFDRRNKTIQPYQTAPWAGEKLDASIPTIVKILRGDFFCMPFGGNEAPYRGEQYPVHGETANAKWKMESCTKRGGRLTCHLSMKTKVRKGRVDKRITLIDGHNATYSQHIISGMAGLMSFGHHATLLFPDEPGSGVISTSPFKLGQVYVEPTENPEEKGYSILKPGAEFKSLKRVPMITGASTDLSRYPARRGFEDLVQILADPDRPVAWTAVTFPKQRYVWFALKDPRVLTGTIFWISNGGRHYAPWNGRHVNAMGLEEVTSYFHIGLSAAGRPNPFTRRGFKTAVKMDPRKPLTVNYIQAVATIPAGFDQVKRIDVQSDTVTLIADNNKRTEVPIDGHFLNQT